MTSIEVSVADEIADTTSQRPHVLLLGAGASRAAVPSGDKNGTAVPLLREIAESLDLFVHFPPELLGLAREDFEAAYSRLAGRDDQRELISEINEAVAEYFAALELPDEPNLYDVLTLSLREKDAIFTFNWDPFLLQSRIRLAKLGGFGFPSLFFLHGNVLAGFCSRDQTSGLVGRRCARCGQPFGASSLLYPVEEKNYQDGHLVEREWTALDYFLSECFMLTVFGYSAPNTDVEAVARLEAGWGSPEERSLEQTEIINRPGADEAALRQTWDRFIHSHHYEIHESFYDSWIARHPRRSGEAYANQYLYAKFIENNPIPREFASLTDLVAWFQPLVDAES